MLDRRNRRESNAGNTSPDNKSSNVVWQESQVNKDRRNYLNNQRSAILWFTGLSGSGKSTVANAVEEYLHQNSTRTYILDGDNVRHGLSGDLGFSEDDRKENIRRIGEVSKLFIDAGVMVLTSFISPFTQDRDSVRKIVNKSEFIEIHIECPLEICEERDVKGLYARARKGEIKQFTGIDSPYEEPVSPEITINTAELSIEDSAAKIIDYLIDNDYIMIDRREELKHGLMDTLKPKVTPA